MHFLLLKSHFIRITTFEQIDFIGRQNHQSVPEYSFPERRVDASSQLKQFETFLPVSSSLPYLGSR